MTMEISLEDAETWTAMLNMITNYIEGKISNYALEETEILHHEEEEMYVIVHYWNRGVRTHKTIMTPYGKMIWTSDGTPKNLILDIMNTVVELYTLTCSDD